MRLVKLSLYMEAQNLRIDLIDEPKDYCMSSRRTETCVKFRHVDALRDALLALSFFFVVRALCFCFVLFCFVFILRANNVRGRGMCAAGLSRFVLFSLFSRPQAELATV